MVKNIPELDAVSDEILVRAAKNGDSKAFEVLASRFRVGINARARTYFLRGADKEDIIQEGMIGLVKAIRALMRKFLKYSVSLKKKFWSIIWRGLATGK